MAYALSDRKVALSLTGGYDSRLVFAYLKDHLTINVFLSCHDESDPDVIFGRKTAEAAGGTLEVLTAEKPPISEVYLEGLFEYAQGIVPFVNDGFMRVHAFMKNRSEKGYTCYLTGDGGPRHKDWYWIQDLPFYRRKHTNVARFYDQRIEVIPGDAPVGDRLKGSPRTCAGRLYVRWVDT